MLFRFSSCTRSQHFFFYCLLPARLMLPIHATNSGATCLCKSSALAIRSYLRIIIIITLLLSSSRHALNNFISRCSSGTADDEDEDDDIAQILSLQKQISYATHRETHYNHYDCNICCAPPPAGFRLHRVRCWSTATAKSLLFAREHISRKDKLSPRAAKVVKVCLRKQTTTTTTTTMDGKIRDIEREAKVTALRRQRQQQRRLSFIRIISKVFRLQHYISVALPANSVCKILA